MQRIDPFAPPARRLTRILRVIVGEPEHEPAAPARIATATDLAERPEPPVRPDPATAPGPEALPPAVAGLPQARADAIERRLSELDHGMRVLAETLRRSHAELAAGVRSLGAAEDAVTRQEVEGIVERALVPLAASLERLADAVRGLPLVVSASNERLLQRAVRRRETSAATDEHDALVVDVEAALADPLGSEDDGDQPRLTSDEWSDGAWGGDTPASGPPTSGGGVLPPRAFDQIPDGIDGNGDWFWVRPPRAEDD